MRTSLMVLASLLFLQLLATTAHGIRLDRQLHEALSSKQELDGDPKAGQPSDAVAHSTSRRCTSDGNCPGTTMEQTTPPAAAVAKDRDQRVVVSAFARPVPKFHEDYYGPGGHEPNHH